MNDILAKLEVKIVIRNSVVNYGCYILRLACLSSAVPIVFKHFFKDDNLDFKNIKTDKHYF